MAEPSRKKVKGHKSATAVTVVPDLQTDPLYFVTNHMKKPCVVDLRPFAYGTQPKDMAARRGGLFTGRPELIKELAPIIFELSINAPDHTVDWYLRGLRTYWRLFDRHEATSRVNHVEDINELHGMLQRRDGVRGSVTSAFLKIVNAARSKRRLPALYWTRNNDAPRIVDVPFRKHIALIYSDLKHRVIAARKRFEESDALARAGTALRNPCQLSRRDTLDKADLHATYRRLVRRSGQIVLNYSQLEEIGIGNTQLLSSANKAASGMYPSMADVQAHFLLFVAKSGWNPQTALDIDITEKYVIPHPTATGFHIVRAVKNRGKTVQEAMGQDKSDFSPRALLEQLMERSKPLRKYLQNQLVEAQEQFKANPSDHALRLKVVELEKKVRSPWLFVSPSSVVGQVNALQETNYNWSLDWSDGGTLMKSLIKGLNRRLYAANLRAKQKHSDIPDFEPIDDSITVSDFRDAFAAYAYEASGYNWLTVQLALGHRRFESTKAYLRKRQYKERGEAKILKLTSTLLGDIENHHLVEPAFLFFQVERGELTEEQRQRYFNHTGRTRVGTGCADFNNPPPEISPNHVEGCGCRVQRCTLCRHAIVFPDSVGPLAMRLAELNALHESISILAWSESSFGEEKANTEEALRFFRPEGVEKHLQFWVKEIAEGRHRPLDMEGSLA